MNRPAPWKPPFWLVALDLAGCALLGLGLHAHYAPGATGLAVAMTPFKPLLLVSGGLMLAAGSALAVFSVLRHRRPS